MNQLEQLVQVTNSLAWCKKVAESYLDGTNPPLSNTFRIYMRPDDILAGPTEVGDKAKALGKDIEPISATHLHNAFVHALHLLSEVTSEELNSRERLKTHQEFLVVLLSIRGKVAEYLKWYGEQKPPKVSGKVVEVEDVA